MKQKFFYLLAVVLFLGQPTQIQGTEQAKTLISDLGHRAIQTLTVPGASSSTLETEFRSLLEEGFDVKGIAHFVMKGYWEKMSNDEQSQFISIFENRLIKTYATKFQRYPGVQLKIKDAYQQGQHIIVKSIIQKPGGEPTSVDWRISGGKIHDVMIVGIGMATTIRDEYSAIMLSVGGDVEKFLAKLQGGSSAPGTPSASEE